MEAASLWMTSARLHRWPRICGHSCTIRRSYYTTNQYTFPGIFVPHGCNLHLAKAVKKVVKKAKVATVGAFSDPVEMDRIIRDGEADIVYMARQLLADPETPNKWRTGREDDVVPCVRCNNCIGRFDRGEFGCDVNPTVGEELLNLNLYPAPEMKRRVVVVGGGPGGLTAALTAARRGHEVILLEKEGRMGGTLNYLEHDCHKRDLMKFKIPLASIERSRCTSNTEATNINNLSVRTMYCAP